MSTTYLYPLSTEIQERYKDWPTIKAAYQKGISFELDKDGDLYISDTKFDVELNIPAEAVKALLEYLRNGL